MKKFIILTLISMLCPFIGFAIDYNDSTAVINQLDSTRNFFIIEEDSAGKPQESYKEFNYTPLLSKINVPIEVDVNAVQNTVNNTLKGLLFEDNNIEDDSLKLKVWKNGEFGIQFDGEIITVEVPLKLWIQKRIGIMGLTYRDQEIEAGITVKVRSRLQISKSWGLISKSEVVNYQWTQKPTAKIVGLNVPITYIVDNILKNNKETLENMVDKSIMSSIPTQDYVRELWETLQQPIPISTDDYKAWIVIKPNSILMKPINGNNGKITTGVNVECKIDVIVGNSPRNIKIVSLPECRLNPRIEPGFELNILANIPYSIIDSVAMANVGNQPFGEGKHVVYVDQVKTYGQNDNLVIGLDMHGFVNGNIYLTGVPYLDKEEGTIRLKNIAYKFKTKNLLHSAINFVIKPILKNKIEKLFEIPMKENFYLIEQMANSSLMNTELAENVYTKGEVTKVEGGEIFISEAGVQAQLNIKGAFHVLYK